MPGASSSLLPNKYFDNLYVNRLKAIHLKSDNLNDDIDKNEISYLFSIISKNAEITNNDDHLLFKIKRSDSNIIKFSDRPKRIVHPNFSFDEFAALFLLDKNSSNSFTNDPPNVVLSTGKKQQVYELFYETHNSYEDDTIDSDLTFKLVPLENENIIYETGTLENISLFVDNIPGDDINLYNFIGKFIDIIYPDSYDKTAGKYYATQVDTNSFITLTFNDSNNPPSSINLKFYQAVFYTGYATLNYIQLLKNTNSGPEYKYENQTTGQSFKITFPNTSGGKYYVGLD